MLSSKCHDTYNFIFEALHYCYRNYLGYISILFYAYVLCNIYNIFR